MNFFESCIQWVYLLRSDVLYIIQSWPRDILLPYCYVWKNDSLFLILIRFHLERGRVSYKSKFLKSEVYNLHSKYKRIIHGGMGNVGSSDPTKSILEKLVNFSYRRFYRSPVQYLFSASLLSHLGVCFYEFLRLIFRIWDLCIGVCIRLVTLLLCHL